MQPKIWSKTLNSFKWNLIFQELATIMSVIKLLMSSSWQDHNLSCMDNFVVNLAIQLMAMTRWKLATKIELGLQFFVCLEVFGRILQLFSLN